MRADVARADRLHAVRSAAEGWRRAGAIDDATLRAIVAAYPDDRARLGLGLRILAGFAALVGGVALVGLSFSLLFDGPVVATALTIVFALATELQVGRLRRAQAGAEYSTAILAAISAGLWILLAGVDSPTATLGAFSIAFALAAWRWGFASLAAVAAVFSLWAAAQAPFGRLVWLAAGFASFPLILRLTRSPRWPPSHRWGFMAVGLVFLAGAYVAANIYALDHGWPERIGDAGHGTPPGWSRVAAFVATISMPPLVLFAGVRHRDRALLAAGAVFTAASLATLRHYHPIGPWWLALILGGTACLAIAISLRRWLHAGPGHERSGFTAVPLFEDRRAIETAQAAAVLAAMSPQARVAEQPGFEGGGGRSGGGGATGGG